MKARHSQHLPAAPHGVFRLIPALLLVYPILGTALPVSGVALSFFLAVALIFVWAAVAPASDKGPLSWVWLVWLLLALVTALTMLFPSLPVTQGLGLMLVYVAAIVGAALLSVLPGWHRSMILTLLLFLSVHAVATIFFYLFPEVYSGVVRPALFPNALAQMDYRDALTPQYNQNAVFNGVGLVLSAGMLFTGRQSRSDVENKRARHVLLVALFLVALLLTTGRGALLYAIATVLLVYSLLQKEGAVRRTLLVTFFGAVALFVAAQAFSGVSDSFDRLFGTFEGDDLGSATSGRVVLWEQALAGWREHPWIGNGWRTFQYTFPSGLTRYLAHNQVLGSLYETGIVGTALYVVAAIAALAIAVRRLRRLVVAEEFFGAQHLLAVAIGLQVFYLLYGNTTGQLLSKEYTFVPYFVAIAIGLGVALCPDPRRFESEARHSSFDSESRLHGSRRP